MARTTLTEARVGALKARKTAYDIRDGKLKGFGVRVLRSGGKRFFIHCQHRGERVWKIVDATDAMSLAEARKRAAAMLAAIQRDGDPIAQRALCPEGAAAATGLFRRRIRRAR